MGHAFPHSTLKLIQPYFNRAKEILGEHSESKLRTWPNKVEVIERGPVLLKPTIKAEIQQLIYQSLLEEFAIRTHYLPRDSQDEKQYLIHPLGIVSRMGVLYLICTLWNYKDIKQFALHRFISAKKSEEPYQQNDHFNLQSYTKDQQ
jgi:predicted DNA-binding transcriptional regulator YafY